MNDNTESLVNKSKWNPPQIFSLSVKRTAGGGDPAHSEESAYDPQGGGGS